VALAEDFRSAVRELPDDWRDARIVVHFRDPDTAARAASLLAGINPGRHHNTVRFYATRRGAGHGPDVVASALRRLDRARIHGDLEIVASGEVAETIEPSQRRPTLAAEWDAELAALPPDWSDVYAEVELRSTDHLELAALMMSPLNPSRFGGRPGLRFRCARNFGYGAAPALVRRCLERLDERQVRGEVRILRALSDTRPVGTQGPVWYVGGKVV
jgi:hypothetical protein